MKTTLNFDDRLIKAAKVRAAEDGEPLTRLIERAIRQYPAATTADRGAVQAEARHEEDAHPAGR